MIGASISHLMCTENITATVGNPQPQRDSSGTVERISVLRARTETFEAFERNVVKGVSAPETARLLGINVASVHAAKSRVTEKLRELRERRLGGGIPSRLCIPLQGG
jgi:hypothetical protein